MHEKKEKIIGISMKLFAEKGYHATSIQEIVQKANVSKGAFYLYFQSKDDLLIAIFEYYTKTVFDKLAKVSEGITDPYEQLEKQVTELFTLFRDHKEYLLVHFRENINIGEKLDNLIFQLNKQGFEWIQTRLTAIYGEKLNDHIVDVAIHFDGIMNSYFKWIALHRMTFDPETVAKTLIKRMDILIQTILTEGNPPLFTIKDMKYYTKDSKTKMEKLFEHLSIKIDELKVNQSEKAQLFDAIAVIKEEAVKEAPKKIILKSMLDHLCEYEELSQPCEHLSEELLEKDGEGTNE
ncbi:transcriptional regulator, TetR family [Gracilibacillus ureilyticus]|uniref:Transcriptional regulator, TetR family n=1 Tax=Gracilibacillus ureilyticus TaxID=531814 RepID=A0A1H9UNF2_9BACI|nr:TetR/AcrR family transcriptional regulator [Gracilibacillus ureilyticus]SES10667.1 transcriptional regulator, TetR family [Gracilibacillus ureilyticus]